MFNTPFVGIAGIACACGWVLAQSGRRVTADRRNVLLAVVLGLTPGGMYFIAIELQAPQFMLTPQ